MEILAYLPFPSLFNATFGSGVYELRIPTVGCVGTSSPYPGQGPTLTGFARHPILGSCGNFSLLEIRWLGTDYRVCLDFESFHLHII